MKKNNFNKTAKSAEALMVMIGEFQNCYQRGDEDKEPITLEEINTAYGLSVAVNEYLGDAPSVIEDAFGGLKREEQISTLAILYFKMSCGQRDKFLTEIENT